MLHGATLAGSLAVLWLLLSGHFEPVLLSFGVVSVILTVLLVMPTSGADGPWSRGIVGKAIPSSG